MPDHLPSPGTLAEAVEELIQQNTGMGNYPGYFAQAVRGMEWADLIRTCSALITSAAALEALERAIDERPGLLTLEDLVAQSTHGREWGFSEDAMQQAEARVEWFDQRIGGQRWTP